MNRLTLTSSPHLHAGNSTRTIMIDVLIALFPMVVASTYIFGLRALLVIAVTTFFAVASEYVTRRVLKREQSVGDLSAAVTGILLGFCLPATIPLWMAALGSVIAIVVAKQLFGGIGQNFVNPALVGRIVLTVSFPAQMSSYPAPINWAAGADAVTAATPLAESAPAISNLKMLFGFHAGSLGETCAAALLIGGVYLLLRGVITPVIPFLYIGTTLLLTTLAGENALFQLMAGGLLLGAIYMATDYSTSPINLKGQIIYAIGCGVITAAIRLFGSMPEGVSFSILLMNILVPHIEKMTTPKPFGARKQKAE